MGDDGNPKKALAVVADKLAEPVYADAIQPVAREAGRALWTAGYFVRLATRPFQTMALAGHLGFDWLDRKLAEKFQGVPQEKVVEPPANVAGPLMLAAGFTSESEAELRELYAQLLKTAMHADTRSDAHPAFVEIVRQLTPYEAQMLKPLSQRRTHPAIQVALLAGEQKQPIDVWWNITDIAENLAFEPRAEMAAIDNFARLGLIEVDFHKSFSIERKYECVLKSRAMAKLKEELASNQAEAEETRGIVKITRLGHQFLQACLGASHPLEP